MKLGGPWNLKGRRPRAHEPARDIGQRPGAPGVSVGEWLNSVIQRSEGEDDPYERPYPRESMPFGATRRREGGSYRDADRGERPERPRDSGPFRNPDRDGRPARRHEGGPYRENGRDERSTRRHGQPEGGPFRNADRDERRQERQREDGSYRDDRHPETQEPRRDDNPYRDTVRNERRPESQREDGAYRDNRRPEPQEQRRDDQPYRNAAPDARAPRLEHQHEFHPAAVAQREEPSERRDADEAAFSRDAAAREAADELRRRNEFGNEFNEVNARLDKLAQQLERVARVAAAPQQPQPVEAPRERHELPLTGAPMLAWETPSEPHDPPPPHSTRPQVQQVPSEPRQPPRAVVPPPQRRRASAEPPISIDDAVAEIAARQRVLDGDTAAAAETAGAAEAPGLMSAPAAALDFDSLEQQLRQITARIEALQPSNEIENAIAAVRSDLAEIGRQLNEALPRRALESLESEIRALGERIDLSRQAGVDPHALAGIEHGLAEVREALRGLTPAESLVGADEAVHALAQKVDMILARDDPAMLQQLEAAIGGLRGVVAHVASNDTLNQVAEDVRVLAAQVDAIANNAVTAHAVAALEQRIDALTAALQTSSDAGHFVSHDIANNDATAHAVASLEQRIDALTMALQASSEAAPAVRHDITDTDATAHAVAALEQRIDILTATLHEAGQAAPHEIPTDDATAHAVASLEQRIDALTAALHASSEAGQAVPHDLEKLLAGLIDKLEWVQLTHTDHAALAHLEDRIATLVRRFDASEARFTQLEAIERGLADLLVHVEQIRGSGNDSAAAAAPPAWQASAAAPAFQAQATATEQSEPWIHDSPAPMRETVEHVADRLAMIESNVYDSAAHTAPAQTRSLFDEQPAPQHAAAAPVAPDIVAMLTGAPSGPAETATAVALPEPQPVTRPPIDPSLPPDHPLEPGFTGSRARPSASAAERVAASEAAIGSAKPPVIPDAGRPNFIAAARRAAQAAAWEPSTAKAKQEPELAEKAGQPSKLSQRLRKLIVAASALLIVVGCARIAMRLLDDGRMIGSAASIQSQQIAAPAAPAPVPPAQKAAPANPPAAQAPALPLPSPPGAAASPPAPAPAKTVKPEQQSLQQDGAHESVANAAPPAAQPGADALPLWATPDITGTLPRGIAGPEKPRAAAPAAASGDDNLPASIGDPALRAAALAGDPAAAYEIAVRFAEGRGVPKNTAAAAQWLEHAAKQGLTPAQFRLGSLYEKGIGVKKDLVRARELYLAAAQKGNGKAMHNLAVLYAEGVDGAPDYTTAAEWFRRGADHGVSDSQYNLGILYARGIGVSQNYGESYKWFALAANQGDHDAASKRDDVASHLDAQALAAARAAVQNFKPEPQPDEAINVKTAAAWQLPPPAQQPAKSN